MLIEAIIENLIKC